MFFPSTGTPTRSSAQWWQINTASGSLGVVQQLGKRDDPSNAFDYAYPTLDVNANDDMMLGYSRFGASQYASANYSYRLHSDPPNTLEADTVFKAGEAPYFKDFGTGDNRWGDYSNVAVDPINDIDLWTIQEYAGTGNTWGTWWGMIALSRKVPTRPTATRTSTPTPTRTRTPKPSDTEAANPKPTPTRPLQFIGSAKRHTPGANISRRSIEDHVQRCNKRVDFAATNRRISETRSSRPANVKIGEYSAQFKGKNHFKSFAVLAPVLLPISTATRSKSCFSISCDGVLCFASNVPGGFDANQRKNICQVVA